MDNDPSTVGTYNVDERYVYDGNQLVFVVNSSDTVVAKYAYTPGLPEVTMARLRSNAYWLFGDQQGTVKDVVGIGISSTTPDQHIRYDAYGNIVSVDGSLGSAPLADLGFTGQELDNVTGLLNYGARWYDPATGRFISKDSSGFTGGGDMNLYRYVGNNVTTLIDTMGLSASFPSAGGYSPLSSYIPSNFSIPNPMTGLSSSSIWNAPSFNYSNSVNYSSAPISSSYGGNLLGGMNSLPTFGFNTSTPSQSSYSDTSTYDFGGRTTVKEYSQ